jgi:hypothetical protein
MKTRILRRACGNLCATGIGLGVGRLLREQDIARFDTLIPDAEGRAAHKGGCQYGNLNRATGEGPTPWPNQGFQCQNVKAPPGVKKSDTSTTNGYLRVCGFESHRGSETPPLWRNGKRACR